MTEVIEGLWQWGSRAVAFAVGAWFVVRFVFEPHVKRIVSTVFEEKSDEAIEAQKVTSERVSILEQRMAEQEKTMLLITQSLKHLREGFDDVRRILDRVDEKSVHTAEAVARIEGYARRDNP